MRCVYLRKLHNELLKEEQDLQYKLSQQNKQLSAIQEAESLYQSDGNIENLISFWENIWSSGGLLFNGSKWTFRLPDIYIKEKRYDDALRILLIIRSQEKYIEKADSYIRRVKSKIK